MFFGFEKQTCKIEFNNFSQVRLIFFYIIKNTLKSHFVLFQRKLVDLWDKLPNIFSKQIWDFKCCKMTSFGHFSNSEQFPVPALEEHPGYIHQFSWENWASGRNHYWDTVKHKKSACYLSLNNHVKLHLNYINYSFLMG